mmetsp:Transcript_55144/g.167628  ORF Transcript_55144/g.167628 Transcript_55144/m.167628 type:complete len:221 (+) Transcript_55144:1514-2176(+)
MRTALHGTRRWRTCWRIVAATCCASKQEASPRTCRSCKASSWASRAPRSSACITYRCKPSMSRRALRCIGTSGRRTSTPPTRSRAWASRRPIGGCWPWTPCSSTASASRGRHSSASRMFDTLTCSTGSRNSMGSASPSPTRRKSSSPRRFWPFRANTPRRHSTSAGRSSTTWPSRCTPSCGSGKRPSTGRSKARPLEPRRRAAQPPTRKSPARRIPSRTA